MSYVTSLPVSIMTIGLLILYIVIFSVWADYEEQSPLIIPNFDIEEDPRITKFYKPFVDVAFMVFIGFGYLMAFLKHYGFSAIGYTFCISAIVVPWAVICIGFFQQLDATGTLSTLKLDLPKFTDGLFAAASVMIAFGAVLGKTTPFQLLCMAFLQVMFYAMNYWLCLLIYKAIDIGGSLVIHVFGAYFGVTCAFIMSRASDKENENAGSTPVSDNFSLLGTLFLWILWPSFNSALAPAVTQQRCIINTFLSICGSCIITFGCSFFFNKGKYSVIDVQNATLAGGVAVGCAADLVISPGGSLGVGLAAGLLSTFGFNYLQKFLLKYLKLHDTCGVNNLHGMPGILAGVVSIISTAIYFKDAEEEGLFPREKYQALAQFAALGTSFGLGIGGGIFAGLVMRFLPYQANSFIDTEYWIVEEEHEK